jgi:outer membrane protein insertion porin family
MFQIRKLNIFFISLFFCFSIYSQTIDKINIRGNKKITSDAIKAKLLNKEGSKFDESLVRQDIDNVFKLGYFDEVEVYKDTESGFKLIIKVREKPTVSTISFEGNSSVDTDDLKKHISVQAYTVLNIAEIKRSTIQLMKYYEEKGFYLASVKEEIRPAPQDPDADLEEEFLEVVFKISENSKIKVDTITILGNKELHDNEIKNIMESKEKGVFSWISGSGNYRESIVDIDRERIAYYYTTRGFPHAQVYGPITHVTPDKKWIYLTYTVDEGAKYDFGEIKVKTTDPLFTDEELYDAMKIKTGDLYNSLQIRDQIIEYQNMYGNIGYAFTNVVPIPSYNEKEKTVDIVFDIDKGRKVHFGKIRITGNSKTREKVIRRELRINEGELYNYSKKELSRSKIMALGYFDDVVFKQYSPKDPNANPDTVNIDIKVIEKSSTGQFMVSAGYSTYEGFITMFQVQENNFMGRGQTLTLRANISKVAKLYYFGFYDPYFLDSNWGWGLDVYRQSRQANGFETIRTGFDTRFSYPLTDFLRGYVDYKLEYSKTTWISTLDGIFDPDVENGFTSAMLFTLENDKRNDRLNPTKGLYNAITAEIAGLGGSKHYVKTVLDNRFYTNLFWGSTFKTRLLLGNITPYGSKPLPYGERFLMGGIDSLRGFEYLTLGPQVTASDGQKYAVGGKNQILYSAEWEFPIAEQVGIKGVVFFDAGNAFNTFTGPFSTDVPLRSNWGMGFRWFSPMGPLRFEWGVPINRRTNEAQVVFQFMIGPSF